MLSSAAAANNGNSDTFPGDYESWSPGQPLIPEPRTPFPRLPPAPPPTMGAPGRTPFPRLPPTGRIPMRRPPVARHVRPRRHRRRPLTPEIVIDRRHRSRSSWGGRRVFTVPLDNRPTLGLRGPPRRCIEIERVRCLRTRRRPRSECYEYEYEYDDPPPPIQPIVNPSFPVATQPPLIVQMVNPSLPVATQPSAFVPTVNSAAAATSTFLSNLTAETIENLPRQTVHLPPIHLPGSHADVNTELDTVIFPAEIINPVDGTLSIIQVDPNASHGVTTNIHPTAIIPAQPQMVHLPAMTTGVPIAPMRPPVSPALAGDPLMQRFQQLFQRLSMPQTQPILPAQNISAIRTPFPNISTASNPPPIRTPFPNISSLSNPPTIRAPFPNISSASNPPTIRAPFPNISSASNPPTIRAPFPNISSASNTPPIRTPFPNISSPSNPPSIRTPFLNTSSVSNPPTARTPFPNMSSFNPTRNVVTDPPIIPSINSGNAGGYSPASITGYRPSSFTPSASMNNPTYRPASIVPSNASDMGPYQPANITPYTNINNRSSNNPLPPLSSSSGPTPYTSTSSAPSNTLTPFPRLYGSSPNTDNNSTPPTSSMPKSILRNPAFSTPTDAIYTPLNSPNAPYSNNPVRKTTTFT